MTIHVQQVCNDPVPTYAQLTLGKTRLLFPGTEILSLDATPEFRADGPDNSIGIVKLNGAELPVYNFDEQLQLNLDAQNSRRNCVCLGDSKTAFGLMCDKVETIEGTSLQMIALSACMRTANTPIQCLAVQGTRILCVVSVERFAGYIKGPTL